VAAVTAQATEDARHVALFLKSFENHVGIHRAPDEPLRLPLEFLVRLAAALRIFVWEVQGLTPHLDANLPDSDTAFHDAFFPDKNADVPFDNLMVQIMGVLRDQFAWRAGPDMGADVVLGRIDDAAVDAALDSLANLLWSQRHHFKTT
jgi:hypothetical protein